MHRASSVCAFMTVSLCLQVWCVLAFTLLFGSIFSFLAWDVSPCTICAYLCTWDCEKSKAGSSQWPLLSQQASKQQDAGC